MEIVLRGMFVYWIASFFTELVIVYYAYKIVNQKINWKKLLLTALFIDTIVAPTNYLIVIFFPNRFILSVSIDYFVMFFNYFVLRMTLERDWIKSFIASSFAYFIFYQTYVATFALLPAQYSWSNAINQTISVVIMLVLAYIIGKLIDKLHVSSFVERCIKKRLYSIIACIVGFFLAGYTHFIWVIAPYLKDIQITYSLFAIIILLVLVGLFEYNTKNIVYKERQNMWQSVIEQQQSYIQNLEEIQKNLKIYRHDFKNIMSGIYLSAKEGNIEKVKNFMQEMFEDFETSIDGKINLANQLTNIYITEVKSLLMLKINEMQQHNIPLHLEVFYPVKDINMDKKDLIRCIGILLDNAIEEAKENNGDVVVVITSDQNGVLFLIENSISKEISISNIRKKGYSTKGEDRGLGLFSYQQITDKYENITRMTSCQHSRFIQELRIGGSGK